MRLAQKIMTGMLGGGNLRYQPNANLPTDLISWWAMEQTSGGTAAVTRYDSQHNNNLADINTTASGTGVIGNGADFVAVNTEALSKADGETLSMGDIDFCIAGLVQFDIAPGNNQGRTICGKWNISSNREYLLLWERTDATTTNHIVFQVSNDGTATTSVKASSLGTPQINTPHFVVAWHDATANTINIQVNNGTVDSAAHATGVKDGNSTFYVGSLNLVAGYFMDGMVDELAVWKRILTQDERTWLYNEGAGRTYADIFVTVDFADLPGVLRANAAAALTTPTYDGSGQATHPSVVDFGSGNTWNGYRYWMAMTPYPTADSTLENPSILASNDGNTWVVPAGVTNPIISKPATGTLSDTEICMDADDLTMWMLYREGLVGNVETIYATSSTDGWVTHTDPVAILTNSNFVEFLSPSMLYKDSLYHLWTVNSIGAGTPVLEKRTCATPDGTWSAATPCTVANVPTGKELWHASIRYDTATGMYHMFATLGDANTSGQNSMLYFAYSSDGINWTCSNVPLLVNGGAWDFKLYRASGVKVGDTYDLFYGGISAANEWRIGRTTIEFTVVGAGKA